MERERKAATGTFRASSGSEGTFQATIATFGVVDSQGDLTLPGALPVGKEVPISAYGHTSWSGSLPIGRGVVGADGARAWVEGQFFLNTTAGRETWEVVKSLGALQEWSYGYAPLLASEDRAELRNWPGAVRILKRVDVFEASPVLVGAGVGTGTDWVKGRDVSSEQLQAIRASLVARSVKSSFDALTARLDASDHQRALAQAREWPCGEVDPERVLIEIRNLANSTRNYASADLGLMPRPTVHHYAWLPAGSEEKTAFYAPPTAIGVHVGREGRIWLKANLVDPADIINAAAHETKHVHQAFSLSDDAFRARGITGLEEEATEYGERARDEIMGVGTHGFRERAIYS